MTNQSIDIISFFKKMLNGSCPQTNNHSQSVRMFWEEARVHRQLMGRTKRTLLPRGFQPGTFLILHTNISHCLMYSEPADLWKNIPNRKTKKYTLTQLTATFIKGKGLLTYATRWRRRT